MSETHPIISNQTQIGRRWHPVELEFPATGWRVVIVLADYCCPKRFRHLPPTGATFPTAATAADPPRATETAAALSAVVATATATGRTTRTTTTTTRFATHSRRDGALWRDTPLGGIAATTTAATG